MVTLKTLQNTVQCLFVLVFLRCSSVQRVTIHTNIYKNQFEFQKGHAADHTIVHLTEQIYESFENDNYSLGASIDLSKAIDTLNHSILLKKLEMYGVNTINQSCLDCQLLKS